MRSVEIYSRDGWRPAIENSRGQFFVWRGKLVEKPWTPEFTLKTYFRKLTSRLPQSLAKSVELLKLPTADHPKTIDTEV